jgi:hypothetical protein
MKPKQAIKVDSMQAMSFAVTLDEVVIEGPISVTIPLGKKDTLDDLCMKLRMIGPLHTGITLMTEGSLSCKHLVRFKSRQMSPGSPFVFMAQVSDEESKPYRGPRFIMVDHEEVEDLV